ncbi:hypothetical protein DL93DRAFT_2086304 [Clavulina sp. PMI_390]|nr:hypothetical protein DL93DRAFT_2086304 [Clavulina sp. PMI_390]
MSTMLSYLMFALSASASVLATVVPTNEQAAVRRSAPDELSSWTGASLSASVATYKSITATFTVPTPGAPSGGSSTTPYGAAVWVGIDGENCGNSILQTGLNFTVLGGAVTYNAFSEWWPDNPRILPNMLFSAGDQVKLTVTANSATSGTTVIENLTKGTQTSRQLTSSKALCQSQVEWIVEDYNNGNGLVPFANFGTVFFSPASVTTLSGSSIGPAGATNWAFEEFTYPWAVVTDTTIAASSVKVVYTG